MRRTFAGLTLGLALTFTAFPALADEPRREEARAHYERGVELFNSGAFDLALIELERAYAIAPTYRLLYYVGQAQIRVGALARALETLERYLEEGGAELTVERREEVSADVTRLRTRTARLTVKSNVDGAKVVLADRELGTTPLTPRILVEAGSSKITIAKDGYEPATRLLRLAGGDESEVSLELSPTPTPGPAAFLAPPPPLERAARSRAPEIVAWSLTGILTTATIITGTQAIASVNRVEDLRRAPVSDPSVGEGALENERSTARSWMVATDVILGTAIIAGAVALYLTVRER